MIIPFLLVACGEQHCDSPSSIAYFPQQKNQKDVMNGEIVGKLVVVDGFIRLQAPGDESYLPLWPPGYRACSGKDGNVQIRNDNGHV